MHGELAGAVVRDSAAAVQQEMLACYALIERQGRGVVYYGSARLKQDSPHWARSVELGREVATLLGCTTWSGEHRAGWIDEWLDTWVGDGGEGGVVGPGPPTWPASSNL